MNMYTESLKKGKGGV